MQLNGFSILISKEALIKSSAVDGGSFSPNLRFEKLEIHKVFLRFPNLALTKNLSPSTLVDLIRASLILNKNHWFLLRMRSGALAEKRAYKTKPKTAEERGTGIHKKKSYMFS